MKDTFLLNKISDVLMETCKVNNIRKVNKLTVVVNQKSHVNENSLSEHLLLASKGLVGKWTKINLHKDKILEQTAILHSIQGEEYD